MQSTRQNSRRSVLRAAAGLAAGRAVALEDPLTRDQPRGSITDVGGLRVGHFTESRRPTGCTVVLFERGAVAGVDVRGSAPGTRETDLLNPINTVERIHALVLSGGSAFGLDTASGVMRYLDEFKIGYRVGSIIVPIVPAAILFDLGVGDSKIRPGEQAGYAACQAASNSAPRQGNVGAGAGATVGKMFGMKAAMKSGIGTASLAIGSSGLIVGAIVAVNAVGDVRQRQTNRILAGARAPDGQSFLDTMAQVLAGTTLVQAKQGGNSTIGIVATNAALTKTQATKIAQMAHDGLARTINPIHTAFDGDTIFAAGTGTAAARADASIIGAVAAEVMALAVNRAVLTASGLPGLPAHRDLAWLKEPRP
jgi:L-aminopeptidase/D-esterase-like protein